MRTYISEAGFFAFLRQSDVAYAAGLIGAAEHRLRLSFLRELVDPNTAAFLEWDWPDATSDDEDEPEPTDEPIDEDQFLQTIDEEGRRTRNPLFGGSATEPELVLRLITAVSPALRKPWIFHQADPDWFPSVPHGHLQTNRPTKLDPYRGWAYDTSRNNRVVGRERRDFIARLWNQTAFRALAVNALRHFCEAQPQFDWYGQRGIQYPMILPKFRRPRT